MSDLISDTDLILRAAAVLQPRRLSPTIEVAGVGAALITRTGNVYVGVNIDAACGIGFCAEHSAIASMITNGESHIETIVAVDWDRSILSPCGRCRELICQVDVRNLSCRVIMPDGKSATLRDLLPDHWLMHRTSS